MDPLCDWQDEWEAVLTHEHRVAPLSRTTYLRAVRQLREFLDECYPEITRPEEITSRHVGEYLHTMAARGLSSNTLRIRLKSLRLCVRITSWRPRTATSRGTLRWVLPSPRNTYRPCR